MGLAAAIAVAQAIALCLGTKYGLAYHLWDIRPQNIPMAFKMMATGIVLSYLAAALCKISVCMGYLKLFPLETNRRFCYMMMIYSGLFGITAFFMSIFVCTPVALTWNDPFSPKRNIVAISVCRIIWLLPVARTSIDFLYSQSRNIIAASVETNLGIICGCLPLVKAFLTHFSRISGPTIRHSTTAKGGGNAYQPQESSSRKHYYSRSRTDLAFNFTCPSRKDSNGYELRAVDSSCDTDERRLVTDIEVVPVPRTIKAHEFVVRTSPLNYENSVTGVADSPCENAR
ncbi:hypothetical protein B0J12DRAFT_706360 [Macrophomina phaseolina]|uniref:Rhodopsin domain-containing protein n=1 Tax=Macrophomina phaseolina TaxID=35725 RepID=A0ABQ8FQD4_9PEZI|nr:hypothetical protein B0J12DRAFT_706360 [Macrophomina phaseolina]